MNSKSIVGIGLGFLLAACSDGSTSPEGSNNAGTGGIVGATGGSGATVGAGGSTGTGATGGTVGGTIGAGGAGVQGGSTGTGGAGGAVTGMGGGVVGGGGSGTGGASAGAPAGGAMGATGGAATTGGADAGGMGGDAGMAGSGGTPPAVTLPPLVTSAQGAYWQTDGMLTDSTAAATVTVNDTQAAQTWEGFGGSFNELGWSFLTSQAMKDTAIQLLFSATDGCNFAWGRIPMGSSDYATSRYSLADTGTDVAPDGSESNRPPADTSLAMFSLTRDGMMLIPYIKAAQAVKPDLRFWASPWTPPVWMKTGYKTDNGSGGNVVKASYFDGGDMKSDTALLAAYAQYFTKFVQGYKDQGINVEVVSPQNEPGYDQNYPSCLWDATTYTTFIGQHLGPAMQALGVKVMLGTMSNAGDGGRNDLTIANAVLADATAKSFLSVAGVQWGVLDQVKSGTSLGGLPVWATEHKCGNYPWNPQGSPSYNSSQAPNDQAYAVESWGYISDAITQGKVTAYNAWNMVLDKSGLGIDTSRDWKQNALLVADSGQVTPTPTYYVFRHFAQYVRPGAQVVSTSGGDAVGFKNPDGSIVAVMFNSGAANNAYVVSLGGKTLQFAMPGNGWATVMVTP